MNLLLKDKILLGLILGFITPLIGFTIFYFARFHLFSLKEYFEVLFMERPLLSGIITISLVANVFIFTLYINMKQDKTAIGIFIASLIYGLFALYLKWY
jgi:tryptophan-rich sensory protein